MTDKIITISREYGSGGRTIGRKTAEALGIPFYDKEIIDLSAQKSGFDKLIIESHEENIPNSFLYTVAMGGYYVGNMLPDQIYQTEYNVIHEIAEKGPCVIVGRRANYILSDKYDTLNIFIHADIEARCRRAVEEYGADVKDARKIVETIDKQRAKHTSHFTGLKWHDLSNYHLCLDSEKLGIDGCVSVIMKTLEELK
ncbi:MAG: cytidylate kinase-like family protein [Clostridia bacterium]|nr:cytidylate kinase-like family protein [Clostridia bacterium]